MAFWIDFSSIFPPNLAPFWPPKSKKIGEQSMSRWLPIITSFFDRFLIDFCFQLRPPDSSKPWFFRGKTRLFQKIAVRSWDRFSMPFGCQLGSILLPKSTNVLQKSDPKRHSKIDRFWLRFLMDLGSVLGAKLEPCWPPFSLQDAPRGFQDAPRTPTKRPKTPPRRPKTPQDSPRTPPGRPQGAQKHLQTTILGRF